MMEKMESIQRRVYKKGERREEEEHEDRERNSIVDELIILMTCSFFLYVFSFDIYFEHFKKQIF